MTRCDFCFRSLLLLVPEPFDQAIDSSDQISTIGTEGQAEPGRRGLLLERRMEVGQIEDPIEPLVALTGEQPHGGFRQ